MELQGRQSPTEQKGWRDEVQVKDQKSAVQADRQLTKAELEGRGSPVEPREKGDID